MPYAGSKAPTCSCLKTSSTGSSPSERLHTTPYKLIQRHTNSYNPNINETSSGGLPLPPPTPPAGAPPHRGMPPQPPLTQTQETYENLTGGTPQKPVKTSHARREVSKPVCCPQFPSESSQHENPYHSQTLMKLHQRAPHRRRRAKARQTEKPYQNTETLVTRNQNRFASGGLPPTPPGGAACRPPTPPRWGRSPPHPRLDRLSRGVWGDGRQSPQFCCPQFPSPSSQRETRIIPKH